MKAIYTRTFKNKLFDARLFKAHHSIHNLSAYLDKNENGIILFKNISDAFNNKYDPFHKAKVLEEPPSVLNG